MRLENGLIKVSGFENGHEGGTESGGDGHRHHPGEDDVAEQVPVDTRLGGLGPADEDDGTDLTVSGADGHTHFGGGQHGEGGSDFDGKATGSCQFGQVLAHGFDDPATPDPETDRDAHAAVEEDVGRRRWALHDRVLAVDQPDGHQGADGVADVVAAVREGSERGRHDLQEGEQLAHFGRILHLLFLFRLPSSALFRSRWRHQSLLRLRLQFCSKRISFLIRSKLINYYNYLCRKIRIDPDLLSGKCWLSKILKQDLISNQLNVELNNNQFDF